MKRAVSWTIGLVVFAVAAAAAFLVLKKAAAATPSSIKVEMTAERLQRGKYIFEYQADCIGCHSSRDFNRFAGWPKPEGIGAGFEFPKEVGLPGRVVAPNITPDKETGIGEWTDGEKLRPIREGVSRDGRALFPFMPYQHFAKLSDEDAYSVVAYLNTLKPVKSSLPKTELDFPVNLMVKFAPKPLSGPVAGPDRGDKVKYGEYLVGIGSCAECHSKQERGEIVKGMELAGGVEFNIPPYMVRTPNLTPEPESGLGKWSEEKFLAKFRGYANMTYENAPPNNQATFTIMPWYSFSQLTDEDLKAIYAYLRTVKPVYNPVEVHPPVAQP
ncbi:MAG: cytochrome c [Acidobacteria bacterium]|nr:cytochrome c [Acidobacteriota bacterium]